ncbi:MAG: isocitrate lyase/PEP mutase family protein [Alphaproteobacteria bacterium]
MNKLLKAMSLAKGLAVVIHHTTRLKQMIAEDAPVVAPLALNPLMAMLARNAGFKALYLGGGATGYQKTCLEANLTVTEMATAGTEIVSAVDLPLILDGAAGWGDPMHMHRTISLTEAAGFAAIEIEDQWLPKRAHHHVGVEHMVEKELMEAKVREAVSARRDPDFQIIARTNGVRASSMDDAVDRLTAYKAAGADILLASPRNAEEARHIGERVEGPLMMLAGNGGVAGIGMTLDDLSSCGWKLIIDPVSPLLAAVEAWQAVYADLADGFAITSRPHMELRAFQNTIHETIDIEKLLDIERRTTEKPDA